MSNSTSLLVASVKDAVHPPSKCSDETVTLLRQLLSVSGPQHESKEAASRVRPPSRKTGRVVKPRNASRVAVYESSDSGTNNAIPLSHHEKLVLATDVFNLASKSLSECITRQTASNSARNAEDKRKSGDGRKLLHSKSALQPTSPNKLIRSPAKIKESAESPRKRDIMDIGLSSLAECACLALSSLRDLRNSGAESGEQFNVQLEQGLCVLVGKLLAIGLSDLAIRELRSLKKRIHAGIGKGERKRVKVKGASEGKDEPLEELIQTGPIPATSNCHQLLISFNAHVLRAVEVERNPSTVNRLPAALVVSNPSSPVNLILAAYNQGVITEEKATLQLQSVSHSILKIAGAPSNSRESAPSSKIRIKPTVTLSLQLLSLEVKSILWKISGHKCDEPKELWEPLARHIANFARRSGTFCEIDYDYVNEAFHRFESTIGTNGYEVRTASQDSSLSIVFRRLGQLAHAAGKADDAVKSYAMAIKLLPADQHLQLALCSCKAALLCIESMPKYPMLKGISAIDEAAVSLTAPLRGTQSDMEELIIESARLKKGAMQLISRLAEGQSETFGKDAVMFRLSTAKFLANFVRLLNRYLLPTTPRKRDTDAAEPCDRLGKFRNVASAAVDSGISIGKLSITTGQPPWPETEELLSDCLRLLIGIEKDEGPLSEPSLPNSKSSLARFSNLYWSLYICEKDRGKPPDELARHLERSVGILRKVSPQEQASGFMALKLERLAGLYSDIGKTSKSDAAYVKSIRAHLDAGALDSVYDDFSRRHPLHIWKDSKSPAFHLGRVLNSFVRSRIQRSLKCVYYDDEELDQGRRAILLEREMFALIGWQQRATDVSQHFSSLLSRLLSLYPIDTYPIRRMRVVLMSLRFILDRENHVENEARNTVVAEAQKLLAPEFELASDSGLSHLRPYTESVLRLALGFILGDIHVDTASLAVSSWVSVLQNSSDWESLEARVDDISLWISQANAVADYLDSQGLWKLRIRTLAVIRQVLERQPQQAYAEMVSCLSQIGLQYSRLGYSEPAHICLSRAEELIRQSDVPHVVLLAWYLAEAEHLLDTAEIDKCVSIMSDAQSLFEKHAGDLSRESFSTKCRLERLAADGALLLSRLSMLQGNLPVATHYAKRAMKLSSRTWARLDRYARKRTDQPATGAGRGIDTITNGIATMNLTPTAVPEPEESVKGSVFWPHSASHFGALVHLSRMAALNGLFQDAAYYGEQALELAKSIGSRCFTSLIRAELANIHLCANQIQKGDDLLLKAAQDSEALDRHLAAVALDIYRSKKYQRSGRPDDADAVITATGEVLLWISQSSFVESLDPFKAMTVADISTKMENMSLRSLSRTSSRPTRQPKPAAGKRVERGAGRTKKVSYEKVDAKSDSSIFSGLHVELICRQAESALAAGNLHDAGIMLDKASNYEVSRMNEVDLSICRAEHLLASAMSNLSSHGVYCVLRESTISLPSVHINEDRAVEPSSTSSHRKAKPTSCARRAKLAARSPRKDVPVLEDESGSLLLSAKGSLQEISASSVACGSTQNNHNISFLLGRISMLAHATTSHGRNAPDSLVPAYAIELGRNTAFWRESTAINFDKKYSELQQTLQWPSGPATEEPCLSVTQTPDLMHEYANALPSEWQAVSLTLSPDRNEFIISRLRAGQTPFLLCLPLKRSDPDDMDEKEFDFDSGKDELLEIIKLANESAHATEASLNKKSKKQWWANRRALDERLRQLLYKIEVMWFGGFRGIFAHKPKSDKVLSSFMDKFQNILDKHLPSRRKRGKRKDSNISLDRNVIELFVNIGSLDDEANPEDSVMDLLYFVVDILQFHGERNAYDEIDFDMMVVETLDAIRAYQSAERREEVPSSHSHTILILDRALHNFPWESLECLRESSVSRMPSLDSLRNRILQSEDSHPNKLSQPGFYADRNCGTFILNPGGDLQSTQASFETPLSALDSWTGVIGRAPAEEEFKQALESRDLMLYFGHGSGAQYIRGRTIKRLDRCAVTFLMGCSSGTMTEAGDFESYGTAWNYLHAGTPALVATLWDVTDKDIDRFASSVFEEWGLVEAGSMNVQSPDTRTGTERSGDQSIHARSASGPASLSTLVAQSRDACILRYLNGAAPVVYGIPVFLK